jgi:hypothetical protein
MRPTHPLILVLSIAACRDWVIAIESRAWDGWKLKYRGRRQAKYGDD